MLGSSPERPRGIVRTRDDELLFVGMLAIVSKLPCVCLSLSEKEKPCTPCKACTRKAEIEKQREGTS